MPHFVHVFPSFDRGGVPIRIAAVINHLGKRTRHTVVALDGCINARSHVDPALALDYLPLTVDKARPLGNLVRFRRTLARLRPDLLLTYNWGATEWALVNSLFPVCRHIHLESGFGAEEADRQLRRRVLFRRLALRRAERIVVPSRTLVALASRVWKLNPRRIVYIPNGVDCDRFSRPPKAGAIPGYEPREGEVTVGTLAPLRPEKNLSRLIAAFARLAPRHPVRLIIVGDGPQRERLAAEAGATGFGERIVFAGHVEAVEDVLGWMDVFALTSDTEQMPNSLLQAMAAARPVAAMDVGDVKAILSPENRPFVAPKGDDARFVEILEGLVTTPRLRADLGTRNRDHVRAHYGLERMLRAYEEVLAL